MTIDPQRHPNQLSEYIRLIKAFLERQIEAQTFERLYLETFKSDATAWSEDEYEVLNDLFGDLDAFCDDPELCGPDDLTETQLRERAAVALEKLQSLTVP